MNRRSGVLLHITSLPSQYGVGTLGSSAYQFVDFLVESKQTYWQVLPLCQTGYGDSPYQSCSAFSVSPYFIDLDILQSEGLLELDDYSHIDFGQAEGRVNFEKLFNTKFDVLRVAFNNFDKNDSDFVRFVQGGEFAEYAMFMSLKYHFNQQVWQEWPQQYKTRDKVSLEEYRNDNIDDILYWQFVQYKCIKQWHNLKQYANDKGILIVGDMPIYVASDSVEVWIDNDNFLLDEQQYPTIVAGCPPDEFTDEGQLWGNPIYNWKKMCADNYQWWQTRLNKAMELFDRVRIDHFRGFSSYYTIRNGAQDAKYGQWFDGYGSSMFKLLEEKIEHLDIIAEDLGFIDDKARQMFDELGYPGMKIVLFAFDGNENNEHLPSNHTENFVAYTGTHDNEPLMSYINSNISDSFIHAVTKQAELYGIQVTSHQPLDLANTIIELCFASVASDCIIQMQDLLHQNMESRMNLPATVSTDNWSYKLTDNSYMKLSSKLALLAVKYNRV